jgi:REP element-mobilizing transposase RayT
MARQLRIEYEGAFYHVTSRGNQREKIFWDDKDMEEFKRILKRTKERYGFLLHDYALMGNHYHFLMETPHANLKQIMQNINTSYTVYINKRHKRFGHLFQGRYKAFIVDKESYLLKLSRYIHLNPVRAWIVETKHKVEDVVRVIAKYYGINKEDLLKRRKATGRQRKIAISLCKTLSGEKNVEVGRVLGITLQAVTNAVRDIDKRREEDKKLSKEIALIKKEFGEYNL